MPNQLKVILCLDPTSKESGALMDVHARACSDPNPKTDMVVLFHETWLLATPHCMKAKCEWVTLILLHSNTYLTSRYLDWFKASDKLVLGLIVSMAWCNPNLLIWWNHLRRWEEKLTFSERSYVEKVCLHDASSINIPFHHRTSRPHIWHRYFNVRIILNLDSLYHYSWVVWFSVFSAAENPLLGN